MFNKNIKSFFGNNKKLLFLNVTFIVAAVFVLTTFILPTEKVYAVGAPTIINHQGRLLDSSGNLLGGAGGTNYCFRFSFYDDSAVGAPDNRLWPTPTPQKMTVSVKNGIFNVGIGDTSVGGDTLNYDFNSTSDTYLNIEVANSSGGSCVGVSSFETLSPRQRIASAGYALNSNAVGGFTPAQSATGNQIPVLTGGSLILGSASAGLSATGTNALTFQSGVTGDLQFFSSLNKLTASGDLTIEGKATTTGLSLNLGSDATGDVYYRNSSGNFQRLSIGTNGQALVVSSGLPSWQTLAGTGDMTKAVYDVNNNNIIDVAAGGTGASSLSDLIALGTNTTGNYVAGATSNSGLALTGTEGGTLGIQLTSSGTTGSTASNSGLEVGSAGLTLLKGCADNQILKYTDSGGWACSTDNSGGGSSNIFATISTPLGTSPVADSDTDILLLTSTGSNFSITGDSSNDIINFDLNESILAGAGLVANASALDIGAGTGITVNANDISIDSTVVTLTGSQTLSNKTFTAPVLGAATATSINGLTISSSTGTLSVANGKTLTVSDNASISGTNTGDQDFSGLMVKANNLSDLANTSTARTNLGLGSLATQNGTFSGTSSGTNTGDNAANTLYVNDYRAANFVAETDYLTPTGSAAGLTSFPTLNQNTTGNAATVTNGVYTTGSYSNPAWITGLAWSKISSTPTTLAGYGITDSLSTALADGKILVGNGSGLATAVTPTGDVTISNTGVTSIAANAVALGTDTTGNYLATLSDAGSGRITVTGSGSENASVTLDIANAAIGSAQLANNAVSALKLQNAAADLGAANVTVNFGNTNGAFNTNITTDGSITAGSFAGNLTGDVTGNVSGNAGTATALAANPTDCGANSFATTIAANGNLTCASLVDADVPNNITVDLATLASAVTNATLTTALTVNTGAVTLTGNAGGSALILGSGSSSISGTNTGDQTISLTGDVTGSGTGSFAATIVDNSIDGTDIALGSDAQGDVMYYDGTNWVRLAAGTSGHFLKTQGAGANPIWDAPAGSGDISDIGNCATGACFTGTSGTTLTFDDPDGDKTLSYDTVNNEFDFADDVNITGTLATSGGLTIDATTETNIESAADIAGDVDGTGLGSVDLDELAVEAELEGVLDLADLQGAVTDAQVPNNITVDLAAAVTNATLTTALTVNTGTVTLTGNAANTSVLTLGAGASSISGTNTGDNATNSQYSSDYRAANFVAGTNYLAPTGSIAGLTGTISSTVLGNSTVYIGTTAVALNRSSGTLALTGITSIDGSAATATTAGTVTTAAQPNITSVGTLSSLTVSGALAANGGITFDNSTDTLGAFTAGGTIAMGTQTLSGSTGNIDYTNFDVTGSNGNTDIGGTITAGSGNEVITLSTGKIDADAITLATSGTTGSTSSRSGLQTTSDGLTLIQGCTDGQLLEWTDASGWACATDNAGGGLSDADYGDIVVSGSGTVMAIDADVIDFADMADSMTLDANMTLAQGTNTWSQTFTGTTTNAVTYTADSLTSGDALSVNSAATAITGNLANFTLSGSNALNTGAVVQVDNTGTLNANTGLLINHYATGTGNLAMRVNDVSGDTTPFVIDGDGKVGIGNAAPAYLLDIQAGVTSNTTPVNVTGSINDFLQYNIQNTSTGTAAQSGFSATADNGTATTLFAWVGINNSTFSNVQPYNIGGANDVQFMGAGNDMYIANNNTSKDIIFSTGKAASPYFNERMRIKNDGTISFTTGQTNGYVNGAGIINIANTTALTGVSGETGIALDVDPSFTLTEPSSGTFTYQGQQIDMSGIAVTAAAGTSVITGLQINGVSDSDAGTVNGINIGNLTSTAATEVGLTIGTGWDKAIVANGDVVIGAQTDSASTGSSTATTNSAAGTFGSQANTDRVKSSVVFKGKLFVATAETDLAGVYRYDGGTTWTLVTNSTPGKAVTGDTANIDAFVMTVHGDRLYIGSQTGSGTNTGAVYYSTTADTTADSFTLLNATRGTFASASQDGVSDMAVYNGDLIIATQEDNLAEIVRYTGGTTFSQITLTDGKTVAETTADKDGYILEVYNGYLFVGSISGAATNVVAVWNGAVSTPAAANWVNISVALTGGTYGDQTSMSDTNSMVVYNGSLYVSMSKTAGNAAAVFKYTSTGLPLAATGTTRFNRINTTVGKLIVGDAADQDSILLYSYNGRLYGGSTTGSTTGALYEYTQTGAGAEDWVLMNTTRGTFGSDTSVDSISTMVEYNGTLYIGTFKSNAGSVYTWTKTAQNSFGLKFDSGSSNFASISFVGGEQYSNNGGTQGSFIFSHAVSLKAGGFDYAEDYPTYDTTLEPGDVVAIDPDHVEYIKRADGTTPAIGIFSKNPGLRLQKPDDVIETGETWVPVALVGRVPLKVSTENGPIRAGDSLTLSETIPGVAMKATKAGTIIARALSKYDGEGVGTVTAFIDNSYSNGSKLENILNPVEVTADDGSVTLDNPTYNSQALLAYFMEQNETRSADATLSDVYVDRVAAGLEIITPTVTADTIDVTKVTLRNSTGSTLELSVESMNTLSSAITQLQSESNLLMAKDTEFATKSDEVAAKITAIETALENGIFRVDNMVTMDNLSVTGNATFGGESRFNGLSFFDNATTFAQNVLFTGNTEFTVPPLFNADTAGFAMIKEGSRKVEVIFDNEYIATPVVNTSISFEGDEIDETAAEELFTAGIQHIVINKSIKGFTILLNKNAPRDIRFSWSALSVKDAKIFESVMPGLVVENQTPAPDPTPDPGTGDQTPAPDPTPDPGTGDTGTVQP